MDWLLAIAALVVYIWSTVKILHQAGYSGWWVLLTLLPIVNLAAIYRFATAEWPVTRAARQAAAGWRGPGAGEVAR